MNTIGSGQRGAGANAAAFSRGLLSWEGIPNLKPKVDCHSFIAQEGLEGFVDDIVDPDTKADVKEEAANYLKHVKAMKLAAIPKAKLGNLKTPTFCF